MKNLFEVIAGSLLYAWRKQMNIPLPRKLYEVSRGGGDWQCAGFPLLGWLLGLLIALAGALTELIFNPFVKFFFCCVDYTIPVKRKTNFF